MKYVLIIEKWALAHLGIELEKDDRKTPDVFFRNFETQRRAVRECFPGVEYKWVVEEPIPPSSRCGRAVTQGELLGAEVDPATDTTVSHPWSACTSVAEIEAIPIPDIRACPGFERALKDYKALSCLYDDAIPGFKVGFLSPYGMAIASPLSFTLDMVGQDLFILMYTDPDLAHAFFRKTMQVHEMLWEAKQEVEECEFTRSYLGDCPNTMCSPETFRDFVLPCNKEFAARFPNTESHNCGVVTHLLGDIAAYGPFRWVELGWGTDLEHAREHFGGQTLFPRLGVDFMQNYTPEQVYDRASLILRQLDGGPTSFHSNCIHPENTRKESLDALFAAVADYEN